MATNKRTVKGIDGRNEIDPNKFIRDNRTNGEKFKDFMNSEGGYIFAFLIIALVTLDVLFILIGRKPFGLSVWSLFSIPILLKMEKFSYTLPFKKPQTSKELDFNQIHPGHGKPEQAKGISFYGNDTVTKDQVWFADDDIRTHCLIFGTTGAGKTEALLSICMNSLIHASGFIYVDGKGDNSLFLKVFSMVRRMGREDDLLLINYMTGTVNTKEKTFGKLSNTMNPFASGSAASLTELIVSLLPSGGSGDGMWKGRASVFMSSLMNVLVPLRDDRKIMLDVDMIRSFFSLEKLEELIARDDIKESDKKGLKDYVWNLPGYVKPDPAKPNQKVEQEYGVYEQHGFITMQYTEAFGLLADVYGHIMQTQLAEVDFYDVVVNRRFLVVLLPALEKSTQSLGNLGKIIVSSIKMMMSNALGSKVEGSRKDVVEAKPTNSPSPYLTVFDEYGYYAVEGSAVMPAQARSLGFSMIFAGQDFQAFKKGSAEEASSIVANCAIKICMKLEDPTETFDIFAKAAGEATINQSSGTQLDKNSTMGGYVDSGNASAVTRSRINIRDLKDQGAGEAHILFKDNFVRTKMFFANPTQVDYQRVNKFLRVPSPEYNTIQRLVLGYNRINRSYKSFLQDDSQERKETIDSFINEYNSKDLQIVLKTMNEAKKVTNSKTSAMLALYAHMKAQKIVDYKLNDDMDKIDSLHDIKNEFVEPINEEKSDSSSGSSGKLNSDDFNSNISFESNSVKEAVSSSMNETVKNRSINSSESGTDKLRKVIQKNQEKLESNSINNKYNPYKIMGMNIQDLQDSMKELERDLSQDFDSRGLNDDTSRYDDSYHEMATEKTIADISASTTYASEVKIQKRNNNKKFINGVIDDILLQELD